MMKLEPWVPGCIVLTRQDYNWRDGRHMAIAAIAERESLEAITRAMRSTIGANPTKAIAVKKWKAP